MDTNYEFIHLGKEESFAIITLDRPPLNLINQKMLLEINDALDKLENDEAVRSVILTGAGQHFAAGADVSYKENFSAETQFDFMELGRKTVDRIESYPKPMISAVHGKCYYGGTGLAWPCDIRIAGESARYRAGDAYLGIISSWGVGMVRIAHYIGRNRALDINIMGEILTGQRAVEIGIASKCVPDDQLMEEAKKYARIIAKAAPISLKFIKEGIATSYQCSYQEAKRKEVELVDKIYRTEDCQEGLTALLEGREPVWKNH